MPKVSLPHTWEGWFVTLASSIVGFIAGTASMALMADWFEGRKK